MITSAASDLASIGSNVSAAHLVAAVRTTSVIPAAADEVSAGMAHLFSQHAQGYQALAGQASALHEGFYLMLSFLTSSLLEYSLSSELFLIVAWDMVLLQHSDTCRPIMFSQKASHLSSRCLGSGSRPDTSCGAPLVTKKRRGRLVAPTEDERGREALAGVGDGMETPVSIAGQPSEGAHFAARWQE